MRADDQVSDTSVLELFGGIGGMASASQMVGATVRALVETENVVKHLEYPVLVLQQSVVEPRYLSKVPRTRKVDGGAPCQPYAQSSKEFGRQTGAKSDEGKLSTWIPITADILDASHFALENVATFGEKVSGIVAVKELAVVSTACGYIQVNSRHTCVSAGMASLP